jgi:hypothetical protein
MLTPGSVCDQVAASPLFKSALGCAARGRRRALLREAVPAAAPAA